MKHRRPDRQDFRMTVLNMAAIHSSHFRTSMFKLKKLTEDNSSLKIFFDRCSSIYIRNVQ